MSNTYRKWIIRIVIAILIIFLGVIGSWLKFLYTPAITDDLGVKYNVRAHSSLKGVIDDLYARKILKDPIYFKLLVRMKGVAHQLKAGQYFFRKGITPPELLQQIITGKGLLYYTFTIVPGSTFRDIRNLLDHEENLKHTTQNLSDADIMKQLGSPQLKPEGWFFPDTYFYGENTEDILLLKKSFKAMQDKLAKAWQTRNPNVPFKTPYEALIGASIIEKEAYIESELPTIAGVMVNRLKKGMLLQFDPTIIYGLGTRYKGKIYKADLVAKDNPYNTYVYKGLPPTPIAMPGMAAIKAIMNPEQHDYYYFVAQSNGASVFTKQLSDHNKAVETVRKSGWFFNFALTRHYLTLVLLQKSSEVGFFQSEKIRSTVKKLLQIKG